MPRNSNPRTTEVRTRARKRIKLESSHTRRSNALNIQDLAEEIILMILAFVPVTDLVFMRRVSRLFRRLSEDEPLWKSLYRNTRIVRPPGPLPHQSTAFLCRALVASAKLERNWPPALPAPIPKYIGPRIPLPYTIRFSSFLGGRWLIAGSHEAIWCYDIHEPNPTARVFYQPHLRANYFRCVSTTNEKGELVAFAVSETQVGSAVRKLNIYKVHVSEGNAEPFICGRLLQFDVSGEGPAAWLVSIGPRLLVVSKPHESMPRNLRVIMDINTLQRYHITAPNNLPPLLPMSDFVPLTFCVLTKAYLLLFYLCQVSTGDIDTFIMACPIPTSSSIPTNPDATLPLQIRHMTRIPKLQFAGPAVLLDVPASSGSRGSRMRIVLTGKIYAFPCGEPNSLAFLDLTLDGTGSMTHTCTPVPQVLGGNYMWLETGPDGCARGVAYNSHIMELFTFLVDQDGEVTWYSSRIPDGLLEKPANITVVAFDGVDGILCTRVQTYYRSYIDVWRFA